MVKPFLSLPFETLSRGSFNERIKFKLHVSSTMKQLRIVQHEKSIVRKRKKKIREMNCHDAGSGDGIV